MCNHCQLDPRDALARADDALLGLSLLVADLPVGETVEARGLSALLVLIHEHLAPATQKLQDYVPRT